MAPNNGSEDEFKDIPHERNEPRPDFSKQPLPKKPLPKGLQDTLDNDEKLWSVLYEGKGPDSTTSDLRYAAYASRIRTILVSAQRYIAYTSDIGESFRPVAHPYLVRGAYAISWTYLAGDVAHEGYKAYKKNQKTLEASTHDQQKQTPTIDEKSSSKDVAFAAAKDMVRSTRVAPIDDYRTVMAQRAIFQGIASMGLPAFTIHSIVKYSGKALKSNRNVTIRTWGPIGLGLAAVPFLPFIFDEPVEKVVEWTFHRGFEMVGADKHSDISQDKKEL